VHAFVIDRAARRALGGAEPAVLGMRLAADNVVEELLDGDGAEDAEDANPARRAGIECGQRVLEVNWA
jgi:hypothetical protein